MITTTTTKSRLIAAIGLLFMINCIISISIPGINNAGAQNQKQTQEKNSRKLEEDDYAYHFKAWFKCTDLEAKYKIPKGLINDDFFGEFDDDYEDDEDPWAIMDSIKIIYEDGEEKEYKVATNETLQYELSNYGGIQATCKAEFFYVSVMIKGPIKSLSSLFYESDIYMIYAVKASSQLVNMKYFLEDSPFLEFAYLGEIHSNITKFDWAFDETHLSVLDLSNFNFAPTATVQGCFAFTTPCSIDTRNVDYREFDHNYEFFDGYTPKLSIKSKNYNEANKGYIFTENPNATNCNFYIYPGGGCTASNECPKEYPVLFDNRICLAQTYPLDNTKTTCNEGMYKVDGDNKGICYKTEDKASFYIDETGKVLKPCSQACLSCVSGPIDNSTNCLTCLESGGYFELDGEEGNCLQAQKGYTLTEVSLNGTSKLIWTKVSEIIEEDSSSSFLKEMIISIALLSLLLL